MFRNQKKYQSRQQPLATINITPFVDLMLVLLIVFIMVMPSNNNIIDNKINLPEVSSGNKSNNNNSINIFINSRGRLFLNKKPIASKKLIYLLTKQYNKNKNKVINILSDRMVRYKHVARLLNALQNMQYSNINLIMKTK